MVQRAKRYRVCVVGIGLAASSVLRTRTFIASVEGHVHDILVGCDENLGDPATKAVGSLDRETAGRPTSGPFRQRCWSPGVDGQVGARVVNRDGG